jgi:hypothetical protein
MNIPEEKADSNNGNKLEDPLANRTKTGWKTGFEFISEKFPFLQLQRERVKDSPFQLLDLGSG